MVTESLLSTLGDYASYVPRKITEELVNSLSSIGLQVSERWMGLCITFISLLIFYLGIKISKPLIKWILIILAIILFVGLLLPGW